MGVHEDPKYWKYPRKFYPEHFLNPDGTCQQNPKGFLPFGLGELLRKKYLGPRGRGQGPEGVSYRLPRLVKISEIKVCYSHYIEVLSMK